MTTTWTMFFIILGCAIVTWLPRVIPFILVKNVTLPPLFLRWLAYIPVCVLAALVAESFFVKSDEFVRLDFSYLIAFIPTCFIAIWTKSLAKTVIVGVITMAVLRNL